MLRYVVLCLVACAGLAHADLVCLPTVAPGSLVVNTNDTCSTDSNGSSPIGTLVADTGTQSFNFVGSGEDTTGNLREAVYQQSSGNLDFLIQLNVAASSAGSVLGLSTGDFAGFATQIGTLGAVDLLGFGPGNVEPTLDFRSLGGDTVAWSFGNPLTPGTVSFTLAIATDATLFTDSNIGVIGSGGGTETLLGFQPSVVPEPTFYAALLLGVVGLLRWESKHKMLRQ
jgi:hypothetical protein